jgi:hypothetical protein
VVDRRELKATIARLLGFMQPRAEISAAEPVAEPVPAGAVT